MVIISDSTITSVSEFQTSNILCVKIFLHRSALKLLPLSLNLRVFVFDILPLKDDYPNYASHYLIYLYQVTPQLPSCWGK